MSTTDVEIVDRDQDVAYSLWALLRWQPGIRVRVRGREEAGAPARGRQVAVYLVSAALDPREIHRLAELPQAPRVLAYADRRTSDHSHEALSAGAEGVVWRYGDAYELGNTIKRLAEGEELPSRELLQTDH